MYRRNPDEEIRQLERSDDPQDRARALHASIRSGKIDPQRVELAARLGDPVACMAMPDVRPFSKTIQIDIDTGDGTESVRPEVWVMLQLPYEEQRIILLRFAREALEAAYDNEPSNIYTHEVDDPQAYIASQMLQIKALYQPYRDALSAALDLGVIISPEELDQGNYENHARMCAMNAVEAALAAQSDETIEDYFYGNSGPSAEVVTSHIYEAFDHQDYHWNYLLRHLLSQLRRKNPYPETMLHASPVANRESILRDGLKVGQPYNLTQAGSWATPHYGNNPIFLADRNWITDPESLDGEYDLYEIRVDGLPLVADLPSLVDIGGIEDECPGGPCIWWEDDAPGELQWVAEEDSVHIDDLLDPGSSEARAAILTTGTAACVVNITPDRITHKGKAFRRNPIMTVEDAIQQITNPEVHMYLDTPIVQTMLMMMRGSPKIGDYYGVYHFLLEHGRYFVNEQRDVQYGPKQQCYFTSQNDIVMNPNLLYVEGCVVATPRLPVPIGHGWNITRDGSVIDRTLRETTAEYWGVVFMRDYVIDGLVGRNAAIALIDNWREDFPLLRDEELRRDALHYEWAPDSKPRPNPSWGVLRDENWRKHFSTPHKAIEEGRLWGYPPPSKGAQLSPYFEPRSRIVRHCIAKGCNQTITYSDFLWSRPPYCEYHSHLMPYYHEVSERANIFLKEREQLAAGAYEDLIEDSQLVIDILELLGNGPLSLGALIIKLEVDTRGSSLFRGLLEHMVDQGIIFAHKGKKAPVYSLKKQPQPKSQKKRSLKRKSKTRKPETSQKKRKTPLPSERFVDDDDE